MEQPNGTTGGPSVCPVCRAPGARHFAEIDARAYRRCDTCLATWLDPAHRLTAAEERAQYLLHENDPADADYRAFLMRLAGPLLNRLRTGNRDGLDFGSGPGPVLADILGEAGHNVVVYDPFFANDPDVLARQYDFITCTETVEHFFDPAHEFARLDGLLKPGGWLGVMTSFQTDDDRFADWHYRRDPTHVVFYREETLHRVAANHGWTCEIPAKDIALMHKPRHATGS